ncbi:MAG: response regulator [Melioribacteraceae bacterium]|nr:response regulator [Melioribacteraceae bacterium]MCF8355168.1 response regulator [Melioribacteraceae bacterium]MCF8392497.1 response regulator [Melioribacteraceae bacterium]MCF8418408.1 response regulator [Melioribacteraceae bacterium]
MTHTILVIEDDPFTNQLYKYIFQKRSEYKLILTDNYEEIINTLETDEISAIVLDVSLKNTRKDGKNIDGIFIAKYLKSHQKFKKIPIILVTAHQVYGNSSNYIEESKADDYISKPLTLILFLKK